jgi:hypothetical protein
MALMFSTWKVMRQVPGLLIALFLAASPNLGLAYSDRTFETERLELIKQVDQILISNKLCSNANDCTKRQFVFFGPESWGLSVSIYEIRDLVVLSEIVKQCALTKFNKGQMKKLEIKIFKISKAEHLSKSIFSWVDYTSIIFKE